ETAAAAVKHHHHLVRNGDSKLFSELFIAHVLWSRDLHFKVMITTTQGPDLVVPSIDCALANFRGVRPGNVAIFLSELEVFFPCVIVFDTPARTLLDQVAKILARQFQEPMTTDSCGDALIESINNLMQVRLHIFSSEIGDKQAHPTVD